MSVRHHRSAPSKKSGGRSLCIALAMPAADRRPGDRRSRSRTSSSDQISKCPLPRSGAPETLTRSCPALSGVSPALLNQPPTSLGFSGFGLIDADDNRSFR